MNSDRTQKLLEFYRQYWIAVLTECVRWTHQDASDFASRLIDGKLPVVLHETPGFWIAEFFMPAEASKLTVAERSQLIAEIIGAIDPEGDPAEAAIDFQAIRDRVSGIRRKFGL